MLISMLREANVGVYTSAGGKKSSMDTEIGTIGVATDMYDPTYLNALIDSCSGKSGTVSKTAHSLQFFIVEGGAEGFLGASFSSVADSAKLPMAFSTTSGRLITSIFDASALIAVFSPKGEFISSALLQRPVDIPMDGFFWLKKRAPQVFGAWNSRPVNLYFNKNFVFQAKDNMGVMQWYGISYYGLWIDDSLGLYTAGRKGVQIDIHKKEATNGCVLIDDPRTPAPEYGETGPKREILSNFEPKFILDIQKAIGKKVGYGIGTMHILDVKNAK
jgi:hypothetical protein